MTNNYLWRGLTQSINEAAIQGGVDYADESGFYIGTWASNVSYDSDDAYSYEHDVYFGYAGEAEGFSYDIGYLYYNYDSNAGYDFGEVYGSVSVATSLQSYPCSRMPSRTKALERTSVLQKPATPLLIT